MFDFTPAFRLYATYRRRQLQSLVPALTQERQLIGLLQRARNTQIGREFDFESIKSVKEYQSRLPLRTYDDFWTTYWAKSFPILDDVTWPGRIPYFCWSSGTTTGKRKYIPYSYEMTRSYNQGGTDLLVHHVLNRPKSKIFGGKSFLLGGTTKMTDQAPGVCVGEVSGVSALRLPAWARHFFFPPRQLSDIADWVIRTEKIAQAIKGQDIRSIGGMPSWLLIFLEKFDRAGQSTEGLLTRLFPNLELFICGGVKFDPYLKQYQSLLAGSHCEFREIYPASEGFFAVADRLWGEGLRLIIDQNIFYEFVPVDELSSPNPTRHWIADVQTGINYALVLTSCSGVWSYILGDTVRFVDLNPARIVITGRTSYSMSAFGEHLISEELELGVTTAADALDVSVTDFTVGVNVTGQQGDLGNHVYLVEFSRRFDSSTGLEQFRDCLDQKLLALNDDYVDHRAPGCGLNPPQIIALAPGSFAAWMASRGKLGSQHKVPRVINDRELFSDLVSFCHNGQLISARTEPITGAN